MCSLRGNDETKRHFLQSLSTLGCNEDDVQQQGAPTARGLLSVVADSSIALARFSNRKLASQQRLSRGKISQ